MVPERIILNLVHYGVLCGAGVLFTCSPDGGALGIVIMLGDERKHLYTRDLAKLQVFMEYWYMTLKDRYLKGEPTLAD